MNYGLVPVGTRLAPTSAAHGVRLTGGEAVSTIVVELYQALREAGVAEQLARDAAHAVLGTDMKDELVTKSVLKSEIAGVRADIAALETRLVAEIASSRVEMIKWAVGALTALTAISTAIGRLG
jgi:urease gamma subunit